MSIFLYGGYFTRFGRMFIFLVTDSFIHCNPTLFSHEGCYSFWKYWPQFKSPYLNFIRSIYILFCFCSEILAYRISIIHLCNIVIFFFRKKSFLCNACLIQRYYFYIFIEMHIRIEMFFFLILHFSVWLIEIRLVWHSLVSSRARRDSNLRD